MPSFSISASKGGQKKQSTPQQDSAANFSRKRVSRGGGLSRRKNSAGVGSKENTTLGTPSDFACSRARAMIDW